MSKKEETGLKCYVCGCNLSTQEEVIFVWSKPICSLHFESLRYALAIVEDAPE